MKRVALTGGIATGKSYVLECFRQLGVPCLDADELAHGVIAPGTEGAQAILERFGPAILNPDGAINRHALGAIVFADQTARRDLEAIIHPGVFRAITAGLRAFERIGGSPLAVVDIPLLYETGRQSDFEKVIATICPRPMQIERLLSRGMSEQEAEQRLAAQMPADEKAARADFVIRTDGSFAETTSRVEEILRRLRT